MILSCYISELLSSHASSLSSVGISAFYCSVQNGINFYYNSINCFSSCVSYLSVHTRQKHLHLTEGACTVKLPPEGAIESSTVNPLTQKEVSEGKSR